MVPGNLTCPLALLSRIVLVILASLVSMYILEKLVDVLGFDCSEGEDAFGRFAGLTVMNTSGLHFISPVSVLRGLSYA